ncbi:hypothetical protein D3C72_2185680 [compost metagenome]
MVQPASHLPSLKAAVRNDIGTSSRRYSPIDATSVFMMNTLGPTAARNSSNSTATTMLTLLRNCTPLPTPDTAERMKSTVITTMIDNAMLLDSPVFQR